nr:Tetratricopeptide repeat-like superfamily protein [Ipomoea batatas]
MPSPLSYLKRRNFTSSEGDLTWRYTRSSPRNIQELALRFQLSGDEYEDSEKEELVGDSRQERGFGESSEGDACLFCVAVSASVLANPNFNGVCDDTASQLQCPFMAMAGGAAAIAAPLPQQPYAATEEAVSVMEDQTNVKQKFDSSSIKTFSVSSSNGKKSTCIGGSSGGGGKFRPTTRRYR